MSINFDHPRHDEDPENDGTNDHGFPEEYCLNCGIVGLMFKDELCLDCYYEQHGPDNDNDLDPEAHGQNDYDNKRLCKDAGR
jgi:hypothetical protein